jgi:hypothetical protein
VFRTKSLFCILFLIVAFSGCQRTRKLPETLDAYHMVYRIDYLEDRAGDIPTKILPGKMNAYYTKYYVLTSIDGFFNQFTLNQVADLRRRRVTTILTFFGTKVYCLGEPGELPAGIVDPGRMHFTETGEMKMIGGLESRSLQVETDTGQFPIFYTTDFTVRRPNISTPYSSVDYPLTDFRIQLSYLKMHLTCSEFETKSIDSEVFNVPPEFKPVTREVMEEIINSLFTKD